MLNLVKGPWLQMPDCNSITIMWETSIPAASKVLIWKTEKVDYGLNGAPQIKKETKKIKENPELCTIHTIKVTELQADTTYYYQVISTLEDSRIVVKSEKFLMKTAVAAETPFSFAVCSETGGAGDINISHKIFSLMETFRPEFLLMVGDSVGRGTVYEEWDKWFFSPGKILFTNTPFYLCQGNHEENSPWFYKFTAYPEPKKYYAFNYGNALFIALDSPSMINFNFADGSSQATEELDPGSPQLVFLEENLKASKAEWKFVFFHYPPFVSADFQVKEMRALTPFFEKYNVDIVFNSHTIIYERSHPVFNNRVNNKNGVRYIVAGGAGAKPEWLHPKRAWHTAQALARPHFVQVIIAGDILELHAIGEDGNPFDSLRIEK